MLQLLLEGTNCEVYPFEDSTSANTMKHSKISKGAFSGPVFQFFWDIFSFAPSFCMVICGMVALTTDVYVHMRSDFQLSLMCHKLNFHEVHLEGPFFFSASFLT